MLDKYSYYLLLTTLVLICFTSNITAQQTNRTAPLELPPFKLSIRLLEPINFTASTYLLGLEHRIAPFQSLHYEAGYATNFKGRWYEINNDAIEGYKTSISYRWYNPKEFYEDNQQYYNIRLIWHHLFQEQEELVCRLDCAYFEDLKFSTQRQKLGLQVGMGWVVKTALPVEVGLSLGGGINFNWRKHKDLPADATFIEDAFNIELFNIPNDVQYFARPSIHLGFHLIFAFSKTTHL